MRFLIPLFVLFGTTLIVLILGDESGDFINDGGVNLLLLTFTTLIAPFGGIFGIFNGEIKSLLFLVPWFLTYLTYANLKKKDDEIKKDELEKEVERRLNEVKKNEESN